MLSESGGGESRIILSVHQSAHCHPSVLKIKVDQPTLLKCPEYQIVCCPQSSGSFFAWGVQDGANFPSSQKCTWMHSIPVPRTFVEESACGSQSSAPDLSPVCVFFLRVFFLAYDMCWLGRHFFCVCMCCLCLYMYALVNAGASTHLCVSIVWRPEIDT